MSEFLQLRLLARCVLWLLGGRHEITNVRRAKMEISIWIAPAIFTLLAFNTAPGRPTLAQADGSSLRRSEDGLKWSKGCALRTARFSARL